ncbi:IstB-like ATP binding protein [Streptomyces sp. Ag109_O5-10]|nr:IstB-like ATP binding protein [Streptomyces sp. Ag109_O5-10]
MDGRRAASIELVARLNAVNSVDALSLSQSQLLRPTGVQPIDDLSAALDELGYMELDRRGAELLFQVLTEREEKNSFAIASNESFGGWTKTFTDPRL